MRAITLPFETWRSIIEALRAQGLPYMVEQADELERRLDEHAADASEVSLHLTENVYLRSFKWARLELEIPLPRN